jgi:hypothetical protein
MIAAKGIENVGASEVEGYWFGVSGVDAQFVLRSKR